MKSREERLARLVAPRPRALRARNMGEDDEEEAATTAAAAGCCCVWLCDWETRRTLVHSSIIHPSSRATRCLLPPQHNPHAQPHHTIHSHAPESRTRQAPATTIGCWDRRGMEDLLGGAWWHLELSGEAAAHHGVGQGRAESESACVERRGPNGSNE